jgi:hypothetical protein
MNLEEIRHVPGRAGGVVGGAAHTGEALTSAELWWKLLPSRPRCPVARGFVGRVHAVSWEPSIVLARGDRMEQPLRQVRKIEPSTRHQFRRARARQFW